MNILQINSSARSTGSESTRLADIIVSRLQTATIGSTVVRRDLATQPLHHIDEFALTALFTAPEKRNAEQAARVAIDDELIAEVQRADVLVIGAPMYNFGVTVQLKSWLDAISRARVTFRYTESGQEGLLKNKKVIVALARGGTYKDSPLDTQVPFLKTMLAFLGMTDVQFVYVEGVAYGPEAVLEAQADAESQVDTILSPDSWNR